MRRGPKQAIHVVPSPTCADYAQDWEGVASAAWWALELSSEFFSKKLYASISSSCEDRRFETGQSVLESYKLWLLVAFRLKLVIAGFPGSRPNLGSADVSPRSHCHHSKGANRHYTFESLIGTHELGNRADDALELRLSRVTPKPKRSLLRNGSLPEAQVTFRRVSREKGGSLSHRLLIKYLSPSCSSVPFWGTNLIR